MDNHHHHHHNQPPYRPPRHHVFFHYRDPPYPQPPVYYYPPPPPQMPTVLKYRAKKSENYTEGKPTVRVYCKAKTDYALTIRGGKVILAPSNPSDPHQHWIKDEKFSTRVKDEEGYPSFALVNKATGQAIKHSTGATYPVRLTEYNPEKLDESVLWTESKDSGDGYRAIRVFYNIELNVDTFSGDMDQGGVSDGTRIVLCEGKKDDNQRWIMVRYCEYLDSNFTSF